MHEVSVTQAIVETCGERAAGARVLRVTVEVGELSCVMPDALHFCYDVTTKGTPLADSCLSIVRVPGRSECRDCGSSLEMHDWLACCACGSTNLAPPRGGDELRIQSMEVL